MKPKALITAVLLVFVFASVASFLFAKEFPQRPETSTPGAGQTIATTPEIGPEKTSSQPLHKVIAYYFHGRARCPSCRKIEAYTHEAIQDGFAKALRDGCLEWHTVNVEKDSNKHFVKDFQLYTKSVVVVDTYNGKQIRWKNLEKVWELLHNKNAFLKYIRDEVRSYLAKD
jgi:hypothetical protein